MANINNPQEHLSVIHVAGNNGKGSVCAYLQYILIAAGYKVGVFTSPHLCKYNERMVIGTSAITDQDFAKWATIIYDASNKAGYERMSFFEILTCMAYGYFSEENVDIAIIETGIGGRLDSTNIIDKPILSIITAPGYDHQELLGSELHQIAAEEAGIIKEGCPVAVYPTSELPVFTEIAKAKNSTLYYLGSDMEITDVNFCLDFTRFGIKTAYFSYDGLSIQLLGEHQIQNAIHALLCVEVLRSNIEIPDHAVRLGLKDCKWPGRFELVSRKPDIIFDGAHNLDGARIFKEAVVRYFQNRNIVLVVGIFEHKDFTGILQHLTAVTNTVICTCSSYRPIPADKLAGHVKELGCSSVLIEEDYEQALVKAIKLAGPDGVVAVAGSLYLIGDMYRVIELLA